MVLFLLASLWLSQSAELKSRTATPSHSQALTVSAILHAKPDAFKIGDSAKVQGVIAGIRHEADGDWHIELAEKASATRAHSIVCEVVPQKPLKLPTKGEHVVITGWLFWDGHHLHEPGRGTQWELHPCASIKEAK